MFGLGGSGGGNSFGGNSTSFGGSTNLGGSSSFGGSTLGGSSSGFGTGMTSGMSSGGGNPNNDKELTGFSDTPSSVAWSPANFLASGCWDNHVYIHQVQQQGTMVNAQGKSKLNHGAPVLDVAWSSDGKIAYSAGCDNMVNMWNVSTGGKQALGRHDAPVCSVFHLQNAGALTNMIVSASWDRTIRYWDARTPGQEKMKVQLPERAYCMDVRNNLLVVLTAPTTMNKKAQVLIFDVTKPQRPFKGPEDSPINYQCKCVATWPNTKGYAVGSIEGRVAIQHIQSVPRKDNFAFKCHRINNNSRRTSEVYPVTGLAFHPNGAFATVGSDGGYSFWDKDSRHRLKKFQSIKTPITCCAFNANGSLFAYGVGYDWNKGASGHNPAASRKSVMVHAVQPQEVMPKKKSGGGKRW